MFDNLGATCLTPMNGSRLCYKLKDVKDIKYVNIIERMCGVFGKKTVVKMQSCNKQSGYEHLTELTTCSSSICLI